MTMMTTRIEILQRNYARNVETPKIQVHILDGHTLCFHANTFVSFLRLLGFRRQASQPLERLLPKTRWRDVAVILMFIHQVYNHFCFYFDQVKEYKFITIVLGC